MGALSVVICAVLSSIFLKERLTLFGWLGCTLCVVSARLSRHPRVVEPVFPYSLAVADGRLARFLCEPELIPLP